MRSQVFVKLACWGAGSIALIGLVAFCLHNGKVLAQSGGSIDTSERGSDVNQRTADQVASLEKEDLESSLHNLGDVDFFYWPGCFIE